MNPWKVIVILMRATIGSGKKPLAPMVLVTWLGMLGLGLPPSLTLDAQTQTSLQAATDRITYKAGEQVQVKISPPHPKSGVRTLS